MTNLIVLENAIAVALLLSVAATLIALYALFESRPKVPNAPKPPILRFKTERDPGDAGGVIYTSYYLDDKCVTMLPSAPVSWHLLPTIRALRTAYPGMTMYYAKALWEGRKRI
jgi:hypothetical protein